MLPAESEISNQYRPEFVLHLGDCMDVLPSLASATFDSCVTDPPYHLTSTSRGPHAPTSHPDTPHGRARIGDRGFMGKMWDGGDIAHRVDLWSECYRLLKPGGFLLAFSGTRTQHRMVCAIEDAGFEIRDQIGWLYGTGFPKSRNLTGKWSGWGTGLKPGWEPICVARKPLQMTVGKNMDAYGVGALHIDACRIPTDDELRAGAGTTWTAIHRGEGRPNVYRMGESTATMTYRNVGATSFGLRPGPRGGHPNGRWPANVIHDGSDEVTSAFPFLKNDFVASKQATPARFFYCAKASKADRNEGVDHLPLQNDHPTVKPTDLMRYLIRLVTPTGGHVLDPFMGSGSTGKAAMLEHCRFTGVEMEKHHHTIADARITAALCNK